MTLQGKTLFISGGSRGIGLAIALRAARDGANIALIAKTAEPHPKLEGTVYTAAEEIEAAGGQALPIVGDIRDEAPVAAAVAAAVERFGGIDVCVNNASAIDLRGTEALDMKRYDLMQDINTRGTFVVTKACVPHLQARGEPAHPHALAADRPQAAVARPAHRLHDRQVRHVAVRARLGRGVPRGRHRLQRALAAHAGRDRRGAEPARRRRRDGRARRRELYADAAYAILTRPTRECTGNTYLCEDVLAEDGVTDLSSYAYVEGARAAGRPVRRPRVATIAGREVQVGRGRGDSGQRVVTTLARV